MRSPDTILKLMVLGSGFGGFALLAARHFIVLDILPNAQEPQSELPPDSI